LLTSRDMVKMALSHIDKDLF